MKLAVSGKGGVGKTTIAAGLVRYLAGCGYQVYAVDADPDLSLGTVLGLSGEEVDSLSPVVEMREAIAALSGGEGAFYTLNPPVEEMLERFSVRKGRVNFLKMGSVKQGGTSCYCRENSVLNALVTSLVLDKEKAVILDMGAGIEHLTRGTARGVDAMLVVTEPSLVSVQTARVVEKLARDLGITRVKFVANKVRDKRDRAFLLEKFREEELAGFLDFSEEVLEGARNAGASELGGLGAPIAAMAEALLREVGEAKDLRA